MRTTLLVCTTLIVGTAAAQCGFDPVISPGQVILCPVETQPLTVGVFDSYQWFKDGQAIVGENGSEYLASNDDSGTAISVEVTLDGCTEMSPAVPIDGLLFPPLNMYWNQLPIGDGPNGEYLFCEGDTLELQMSEPYTANIQWTNYLVPIPGATTPTLQITESGVYHCSGAPYYCPDHIIPFEDFLPISFIEPQQPTIVPTGDELCAFPLGISYTWYHNGEEIEGTEACITAVGGGAYTVFVEYGQGCEIISEPYLTTSIGEQYADAPWIIYPNPSNGSMSIAVGTEISDGATYTVFDAVGREVHTGLMPTKGLLQLDLQDLEAGSYLFQALRSGHPLAPASRFTIVD